MASGGYANSIVGGMLSWLKGFASWVLKLFDLAGSGGISPLKWLSNNWLSMLIFLIIVGVAADWIVWLLRWRPYWVWFRKRRVVVDDEDFFIGEDVLDAGMYDPGIFGREAIRRDLKPIPRPKKPDTVVRREASARPAPKPARKPAPKLLPKDTSKPLPKAAAKPASKAKPRPAPKPAAKDDIFSGDPFRLEPTDPEARRQWEDDVFNVSNLPGAGKARRRKAMPKKREEALQNDPFRFD